MAEKVKIKFWQGLESARTGVTPDSGIPLWTTDNKELWVGDGSTAGGILIGPTAAGSFTVVDAASDTTTWLVLAGTQTGTQSPLSDAGLTYDASTNRLTVGGDARVQGGTISVGVADTTSGNVLIYGGSTGAEGGQLNIFPSNDYDTSFDFFAFDAHEDDLRIWPSNAAYMTTYRGDTGKWDFPQGASFSSTAYVWNTSTAAKAAIDLGHATAISANGSAGAPFSYFCHDLYQDTGGTWQHKDITLNGGIFGFTSAGDYSIWTTPAPTPSTAAVFTQRVKVVASTGYMSIGVQTAPASNLHINGGSADTGILITNTTTGHLATDGLELKILDSGGTAYLRNQRNAPLHLGTNDTDRLSIAANGNVTINQDLFVSSQAIIGATSVTASIPFEVYSASTTVQTFRGRRFTPGTYYHDFFQDSDGFRVDVGKGGSVTTQLHCTGAGATTLYYSGTAKLATTTGGVELNSTDAGASGGPILSLFRDSATPADGDVLGEIYFYGNNSTPAKIVYTSISAQVNDVTAATEDTVMDFKTYVAGSFGNRMQIGGGVYHISSSGGDKGNNTLNYGTLYSNGTVNTVDWVLDLYADGEITEPQYYDHTKWKDFDKSLFTLDGYAKSWQGRRALPPFLDKYENSDEYRRMSVDHKVQGLIETCENQAILIEQLNQKVKILEKK